jgi:hypothetical protein
VKGLLFYDDSAATPMRSLRAFIGDMKGAGLQPGWLLRPGRVHWVLHPLRVSAQHICGTLVGHVCKELGKL